MNEMKGLALNVELIGEERGRDEDEAEKRVYAEPIADNLDDDEDEEESKEEEEKGEEEEKEKAAA